MFWPCSSLLEESRYSFKSQSDQPSTGSDEAVGAVAFAAVVPVGVDDFVVAAWLIVDVAALDVVVAACAESDELAAAVLLTDWELVSLSVAETVEEAEAEAMDVASSASARKANAMQLMTMNRFRKRILLDGELREKRV